MVAGSGFVVPLLGYVDSGPVVPDVIVVDNSFVNPDTSNVVADLSANVHVKGGNVTCFSDDVMNLSEHVTVPLLNELVFHPPMSDGGRVVEIYSECTLGLCSCHNLVGGIHCDLKPCRVGHFLFGGECTLPSEWVTKIWNGLCDGFKIVDEGFDSTYECDNYLSITDSHFRSEMSKLLLKELSEGKVSACSEKPTCIHAMGAFPKSDGRLRPITDCSLPDKTSVNNFMSSTCEDFVYHSVNDVTSMFSEGEFMTVVDIASAYRSVPIYPSHSMFHGFKWDFDDGNGEIFFRENRLCFGLKCAPYIFNLLSSLVVDIARARGVSRVVNYLDDFLIVGAGEGECMHGRDTLISVLSNMDFAVSWKKVSAPAEVTTFLGITIDSLK